MITKEEAEFLQRFAPLVERLLKDDKNSQRTKKGSKDPIAKDSDVVGWARFHPVTFGDLRVLQGLLWKLRNP